MRLSDRTAVVTGGGSGIGAAIALAFAKDGARVLVAGRDSGRLASVAKHSDRIVTQTADVASRNSVADLFSAAREQLGRVDILVNSAGVNVPRRALSELSQDDWDKLLAVNATGAFLCIRQVLPDMRERRDGLIVNISSIAGIRASLLGGGAYTASKFAMSGFGLLVGLEEKDHGIRVTNIYPGEVETPILDQRPVPVTDEHRRRILQPDDVAAAALMVACLPARAHVPELVIKPTTQPFA